MTLLPILAYWSVALWGLFSRRPVLLYLFFIGLPFGSFAVIPPAVTGNLTIIPTSATALLLIVKVLGKERAVLTALSAAFDFRRLALLFAFWLVAAIVTIFMPRLYAGQVMIVPVRGDVSGASPLLPSMQNISQLAYLTISVMAVFAFAQMLKTTQMREMSLHALLVGAAATVATGFLDFASQHAPISPLLEIFRTASYALLVDVEVLGGKRVVGLMPEASSFGSLCLSMLCLLYFLRRGMHDARARNIYAPVLIVLLMLLTWMSTSSAAYVGLAVFFAVAILEWAVRFTGTRYRHLRRRHLAGEFWCVAAAAAGLAIIILLKPSLLDSVMATIDRMVFQKTSSSSFEERNMWTAVSLNALISTYGFGVGLGATRASNYGVALVSNVGIIGAVLYFAFAAQCYLRRAAPDDAEGGVLVIAAWYASIPTFVVGLLIGTTADFGSLGAFRYGLLTAIGIGGLYYRQRDGSRGHSHQNIRNSLLMPQSATLMRLDRA